MKVRAFSYIIISGLLWGTSGIFVHYLAPLGLTSMQMTTLRGLVSAVMMGLYLVLFNRNLLKFEIKNFSLFIFAGLSMFLTGSCYYAAMQLTSVSTSVTLMYTAPLFVMCYSVLFMGEKFTKQKAVAMIFMIVGCGLVTGIIGGFKLNIYGILLGLMSGIAYSSYNIITKIEMCKKINPITASFYCYLFVFVISILTTSNVGIITVAKSYSYSTVLMIAMGILTTALPYTFYTLGLKALPAGTATSLGVIEPLAATLYSVVLYNEKLGIYNLLGILLILSAVVMLSRTDD